MTNGKEPHGLKTDAGKKPARVNQAILTKGLKTASASPPKKVRDRGGIRSAAPVDGQRAGE